MRTINRKKPSGVEENWKLKNVSFNSDKKMILVFTKPMGEQDELLVCIDEKETYSLIKFIRENLNNGRQN